MTEIALAKIRKEAPFDVLLHRRGVTTGVGAVLFTAKVEAGANVVVFGLGGIGLNVIQGARLVGADKIIGVDVNPGREAMARRFGMTDFVNPKDVPNVVDQVVELTDGGAIRLSIGNTTTMRQAPSDPQGMGQVDHHRVARPAPRSRPAFQSSRPAGKARLGGARGRTADAHRGRDMDRKSRSQT